MGLKLKIVFIVLFTFSGAVAQESVIDSLNKIIGKGKSDTLTVLAYNNLCDQYLRIGEQQQAYELSKKALGIAEELNYLRGKVVLNLAVAKACQYLSKFDEGLKYASAAISLSRNTGFRKSYASALTISGVILVKQYNFSKAMDYLLSSLKVNEEMKDTSGIVNARSHIGILYSKLNEYGKAVREYRTCEDLALRSKYYNGLANTYINLSNVFAFEKKLDSSNIYLFKALDVFERLNNKNNIAVVYGNLSLNYNDLGNFEMAIEYMKKCLAIERETGNLDGIVNTYLSFTDLYHNLKNPRMVKLYADSGLALAKELKLRSVERDIQLMLYRSNKASGKYEEALKNYEVYVDINNQLVNEEGKKAIERKEMEFEFAKKEAELNARREKEAIEARVEKRKQQIVIYSTTAGLLMLLVVLVVIVRSLKINKEKNRIISHQKTIVEEKQKEILDSIRYAKRIQTSLLASEKYIDKNIKRIRE